MTTMLQFADGPISVKKLTVGTVIFKCQDYNDKLNPEKWLPIHIAGFAKNNVDEIILTYVGYGYNSYNQNIREAIHPANCVFGADF